MFPLCCACVETENQGNCTHSDEVRCIVGTWVFGDVRKAIELGYDLVNVFEFWEYELRCFHRGSNLGGIFSEYINMYLKLKKIIAQ